MRCRRFLENDVPNALWEKCAKIKQPNQPTQTYCRCRFDDYSCNRVSAAGELWSPRGGLLSWGAAAWSSARCVCVAGLERHLRILLRGKANHDSPLAERAESSSVLFCSLPFQSCTHFGFFSDGSLCVGAVRSSVLHLSWLEVEK